MDPVCHLLTPRASLPTKSEAQPLDNSKGKRKYRIKFSAFENDEINRYAIACLSSPSIIPVNIGFFQKKRFVILKITVDGEERFVKANAESLRKRLNIGKKEFSKNKARSVEEFSNFIHSKIVLIASQEGGIDSIFSSNNFQQINISTHPNSSEEKVSENGLDHSKELLAPEALIDLEDEIRHGIVRYETLQKKQNTTNLLGLSTIKPFLGEGGHGKVYRLKDQPGRVVKKITHYKKKVFDRAPNHEYLMGRRLNHQNFVTVYSLYIKERKEKSFETHKIVMDELEGKTLRKMLREKNREIPKELIINLIEEVKNSCLYLFDREIAWKDLNPGNIFVNKNNELRICDFDLWQEESDPKKCAIDLLIGSMELIGWLLKVCKILGNSRSFFAPISYFDKELVDRIPEKVDSLGYHKWKKSLSAQLGNTNKNDLKIYLEGYFNAVKSAIESRATTPIENI